MFSPSQLDSLPDFERAVPSENTEAPVRAGRNFLSRDIDEKFQDMRAEHARTMALMRALRASPLYRYASVDTQSGGD